MGEDRTKPRPHGESADGDPARLSARIADLERQLEDSQARAHRLADTVEELTRAVGRLDARLRFIHKRWGFRILNRLFRYDRLKDPDRP